MSWDSHIISEGELSRYLKNERGASFVSRVNALIEHQRENWPLFKDGCDSLPKIESKRVDLAESTVVVQLNPKRIRSTAARVDKTAVASRRCFLCADNLPAEELGVAYDDDLVILCNPYPILKHHLSIVHRDHIEQKLAGNVDTLLRMARDLAPDYFVLYNGPECGASAPDHLHFQACSRELLPIEDDALGDESQLVEGCASCEETARQTFEVFTLAGCGRGVIVFRGGDQFELTQWIYRVLGELAEATGKVEPMVNCICTYTGGIWAFYMFPRTRHRPAAFFAEGEAQLTISPGAIDMAGVIVVPESKHFERVGREQLESIFAEVSFQEDEINSIVERVCGSGEEVW